MLDQSWYKIHQRH